jgi:hypothetical protein
VSGSFERIGEVSEVRIAIPDDFPNAEISQIHRLSDSARKHLFGYRTGQHCPAALKFVQPCRTPGISARLVPHWYPTPNFDAPRWAETFTKTLILLGF